MQGKSKKISLGTYIARCGVCSRRKADQLVRAGRVTINGEVVKEPATPINRQDVVLFGGRRLLPEKKVYILLNKPPGYITSTIDTRGRNTVLDLVKDACRERLYPIGRLDYLTTGLLVLTNDGDFAQRLAHPRYEVTKMYRVQVHTPFKNSDLQRIKHGIILEDGPIKVDAVRVDERDQDGKSVIVELHSGRKRIVRRIFQHVGYRVLKLDRIYYAGLTKKGLAQGKWRMLSDYEITQLKGQAGS